MVSGAAGSVGSLACQIDPVSKPAPAKLPCPILKTPDLQNLDFSEVLKLGRLFRTCPFRKPALVTSCHSEFTIFEAMFTLLSHCILHSFFYLLISYQPMSANQENITPAVSLKAETEDSKGNLRSV